MSTVLLAMILGFSCPLQPPVDGAVVRPFAPQGSYGGHWGVDLAVDPGSLVRSAGRGSVTFSGSVAGRLSVTVHHGGGVRTSYSYLSSVVVSVGSYVGAGDVVGTSGTDHGVAAVHYSLRIGTIYVAPSIRDCMLAPADGLRLSGSADRGRRRSGDIRAVRTGRAAGAGPVSYPRLRATRHPRRHLRSSSSRPSSGR